MSTATAQRPPKRSAGKPPNPPAAPPGQEEQPVPDGHQPEVEIATCRGNPAYFVNSYAVIDNTKDDGTEEGRKQGSTVQFKLWGSQLPVLFAIWSNRKVVILKARQLGISWLVCSYVLWHCLFHAGKNVLLFSKGQPYADELIRRISAMYHRLPGWMRERLPSLVSDNIRDLSWGNGSRIRSMPATAEAGVSFDCSLIVLDEAAFMTHGARLFRTATPTIDNGNGQIIVLSTANGLGGFFRNLWVKAVSGENNYKAIFLPWFAHPKRDAAFLANVIKDSDQPATVPENYPANPGEAFLASGRLRFETEWVTRQYGNVLEPIPIRNLPLLMLQREGWPGLNFSELPHLAEIPKLRIFKPPVLGRKYLVSGDIAEGADPEGKKDSDYDTAVVLDIETREEMASLEGRFPPEVHALYMMALSDAYLGSKVIWERNNHGHAVRVEFKNKSFPTNRIGLGPDGAQGWPTNTATKPQGIDLLGKSLRLNTITVRNQLTLLQMQGYSILKNGNTGATEGEHDDHVMAWAIGLSYLEFGMNQNKAKYGRPR